MFVKHLASGEVTITLVYVDDIIVMGNDSNGMENLKNCLVRKFEIKELTRLKYFLGIKVANYQEGILYHSKNVLDLLIEITKLGCKAIDIPIEPNLQTWRMPQMILW